MVVYFPTRPSLISWIVLMFLLFIASSNASEVVDVDAICKNTKNPSFCSSLLNSKPGGPAGADLVTLAQYTIDVDRSNVTNTITLIKSLIAKSGNDSNAKDHYEECLLHFDYDEGALFDIEYTQEMLKSGDYKGMGTAASAIEADANHCVTSEPPYHDTSLLPKYADIVHKVANIIFAISIYLSLFV